MGSHNSHLLFEFRQSKNIAVNDFINQFRCEDDVKIHTHGVRCMSNTCYFSVSFRFILLRGLCVLRRRYTFQCTFYSVSFYSYIARIWLLAVGCIVKTCSTQSIFFSIFSSVTFAFTRLAVAVCTQSILTFTIYTECECATMSGGQSVFVPIFLFFLFLS